MSTLEQRQAAYFAAVSKLDPSERGSSWLPPKTSERVSELEGVVTVSPSQIEAWQRCQRYWAIGQIFGVKSPDTPATLLGGKVHKIGEVYGATGQRTLDPLDTLPGEIFESIRPHLAVVGVEQEAEFWYPVTAHGRGGQAPAFLMHGLIDVYRHPAMREDARALLQDMKTTRAWKWVKGPEVLITDPQAITYAVKAVLDGAEVVDLEWLYAITDPKARRECRPQRDSLTKEQAVNRFLRLVLPTARDIHAARRRHLPTMTPQDYTPNPGEACRMFGGCPHMNSVHCTLTQEQSIAAMFAPTHPEPHPTPPHQGMQMDLLSSLAAQIPAAAANGTTAPASPFGAPPPAPAANPFAAPPPPPPPPAATVPADGPGTLGYEKQFATPFPVGTAAPNGKVLPPEVCETGCMRVESGFRAVAALVKEDPVKAAHYANLAADQYEIRSKAAAQVNPPEQANAITDGQAREALTSGKTDAEGAPKKPGRGRPKGSTKAAAAGGEALPLVEGASEAEALERIADVLERIASKLGA